MAEKIQKDRWRCLITGCNPRLFGYEAQLQHKKDNPGHRTARWPVRSADGQKSAARRNRSGYYDKYNVGAKSSWARGLSSKMPRAVGFGDEVHPFSDEAFSEGM